VTTDLVGITGSTRNRTHCALFLAYGLLRGRLLLFPKDGLGKFYD
jgi:hypothetical protein